jgi:hypothetical protein
MNSTLTAPRDASMDTTDMRWPCPQDGGPSPWGPIQRLQPIGLSAISAEARFGCGFWLSPTGRKAIPGEILSPFGPAWWCDAAGGALLATVLQLPAASGDPQTTLQANLLTLLWRRPDWLDALAAPMGLPNAAQARTILLLWERFGVTQDARFALFGRESDTGMVHGWIGDRRLFVGIEPNGRAHS